MTLHQVRILIADDQPMNRALLIEALGSHGYVVEEAADGEQALQCVAPGAAGPPDLILLDVMMPRLDGLEVCRRVRADWTQADLPIILVSAATEHEATIRGLDAGANDYIQKPFDPAELLARVRTQLRLKRLQDELRAANERLQALATTDPLTGLANHRVFYERLKAELIAGRRYGYPVACVLFDLDRFKQVNDRHGHLAGDALLREVSGILKDGLRTGDCAARYGGEEFGLVLTHAGLTDGAEAAERIRGRMAERDFGDFACRVRLTISGGVAACEVGATMEATDVVAGADRALYRAKELGRNRVETAPIAEAVSVAAAAPDDSGAARQR